MGSDRFLCMTRSTAKTTTYCCPSVLRCLNSPSKRKSSSVNHWESPLSIRSSPDSKNFIPKTFCIEMLNLTISSWWETAWLRLEISVCQGKKINQTIPIRWWSNKANKCRLNYQATWQLDTTGRLRSCTEAETMMKRLTSGHWDAQ